MRFVVVLFSILAPARNIGAIFNNLAIGTAAGARLNDIFQEVPEAIHDGGSTATFEKEVRFEHVWFRYESKDEWALEDINLSISKHERIALVGRSGSGKSTLANLIPRFYDPAQGIISIDGKPIHSLSLPSLRKLVSTVSQDVFLFNDTVRNNICYGLDHADEKRLQEVIERSHSQEFIRQLPHGLETMVGERGNATFRRAKATNCHCPARFCVMLRFSFSTKQPPPLMPSPSGSFNALWTNCSSNGQ